MPFVLTALVLFSLAVPARAESPPEAKRPSPFNALGGFANGPPVPMATYEGRYLPGEKGGPVWTENKLTLSAPVLRSKTETLSLSVLGSQLHLSEDVRLNSGIEVPRELTRVEFGAQYFHPLEGGRNWGARASIGYAGEKPFRTTRDLTYSFTGSYGFPSSGAGYWSLFVFMANNSPFINYFPIPGAIYIYKTPTFIGMFGFPLLSMQWMPGAPWTYSLSLFGPTLLTEAAYGQREELQVFAGYSIVQQSFVPSDRVEVRDRLTLQEEKAALGARKIFSENWLVEVQAGRSYDRTIFEGNGFRNKDRGTTTLPADWFGFGSLKYAL